MHGISKALNRASTQAMQGMGMLERTTDSDFDEAKVKLDNLEKKIGLIVGGSKTLLDSTRAVGIAQSDMSEMLYNLFDETDLKKPVAARYKLMIQQLDNEVRQTMDEPFRKNILDPVNKYMACFSFFDEQIKKRGRKLIDYDAAKSKVRKLSEQPSADTTKMPIQEQEAMKTKIIYDEINNRLLSDIPAFIDLRTPYFDPIFKSLLALQYSTSNHYAIELDNLRPTFEQTFHGNSDLIAQMDSAIDQLRELPITYLGDKKTTV